MRTLLRHGERAGVAMRESFQHCVRIRTRLRTLPTVAFRLLSTAPQNSERQGNVNADSTALRAEVPRNRLLGRLRADAWARLSPKLELVSLELREIVHDVDCPIEHVYFPEDGVVSIV